MSSLNKVILIGYLVANPELKQTQNGNAVTSFRIGVARKMPKDTTDFIDIVAWRTTAEFVCKYFSKGKPILVCGALQVRQWEDKDGNKRYSTEVVADEVSFVGSKQPQSTAKEEYAAPAVPTIQTSLYDGAVSGYRDADFEPMGSEDDLPF